MTQTIINFLGYFFGLNPGSSFSYSYIFSVTAAICFLIAIVAIFLRRKNEDKLLKKLLKPYPEKFFMIGLFILAYLFFRLNQIAVFSARIFIYCLALWFIYDVYRLIKLAVKDYPALKAESNSQGENEVKYHIHRNKTRKKLKKR